MDVGSVYGRRPAWVEGTVSFADAKFLSARVAEAAVDDVVEIGSASGVSTAIICATLADAHDTGKIGPDYRVTAYDVSKRFYANADYATGAAVEDMVSPELREHVRFRLPGRAIDVRDDFGPDTLEFAFIDASHSHPWPALDLLALIPCLRPGAEVAMHDINLPVVYSEFPVWGSKWLFDALDVEKHTDPANDPPNIGSIIVPADKAGLERRVREILDEHEWEEEVSEKLVRAVLGDDPVENTS